MHHPLYGDFETIFSRIRLLQDWIYHHHSEGYEIPTFDEGGAGGISQTFWGALASIAVAMEVFRT